MVSGKKVTFGAALLAVVALAGCSAGGGGGDGAPDSDEPFLIYMNTPLTGALANSAQANIEALDVAVADINESGGILGKQVEVVVADDQLDTTRAVTLLQEQIDKKKPDLVFMGATSNTALALAPLTTRNKIVSSAIVQSSAVNDPEQYPYTFIPYIESTVEAPAIVNEIENQDGTKVALLTANDANGQSTAEGLSAAFDEAGLDYTAETYAPADIDMTPQLQRLQAADPDVLVIQSFGAATSHILSSRTKLGWDIPTIGHSSIGLGQNLGEISTEADWNNLLLGVFPITAGTTTENTDVLADLVSQLKADGSKLDQSLHYYGLYWDILHLMKKGFEQAGSLDPDEVKAALEDLKPNDDIDSQLVTFPVEYSRWSADSHFFEIPADVVLTYVKPGPLVDGVIQSVK